MHRRAFLRSAGTGLVGIAGCAAPAADRTTTRRGPVADPASGGTATDRPSPGTGVRPPAEVDLPVPEDDLSRVVARDRIPAIVDPAFADDWRGLSITVGAGDLARTTEPRIGADDRVIGVARGGEARAYPLRVLGWHEAVNDRFEGPTGGGPLLVTYCPLCGSGVTAVRRVDGRPATFGVSGYLWRSALVLYDRPTDSLWSQVAATAIRGPEVGADLELVPSTLTTWDAWRRAYPDTGVLLPPPESGEIAGPSTRGAGAVLSRDGRGGGGEPFVIDYTENPYARYGSVGGASGMTTFDDRRLDPKTTVIGVRHGGVARAYPRPAVGERAAVNDVVGGLPVVVARDSGGALAAYDRRIDGRARRFAPEGVAHVRAAGSRWSITSGRAVDGPHEGDRLASAADASPMFWFAWLAFNPDTEVYGNT